MVERIGGAALLPDLIKKLQIQVEVKRLEFEVPSSQIVEQPQHPIVLLIEKLGRIIAGEQDNNNNPCTTIE